MLFSARFWPGLADGSITVAYRRQKRPTVKAGGTLRSPVGVLFIEEIKPVDESDITDDDARAAGHDSRAELLKMLKPDGTLYRIRFHRHGEDPRVALREQEVVDDKLLAAVGRLDWALPVLRLIRERPAVVSTDLAPLVGMERLPFKQRVRRLKELGLTESLDVGYRLSPRGEALLRSVDD
jgi:hypothetical protein